MIISASRRTDIPAFYTPWLLNRLREGFALVPNPMNPRQVRRVDLSPQAVEGMVFWTKNPGPLLPYLDALERDYRFYFQFTLTPYGPEVEPGLPRKSREVIPTFQRLGERLGPERVIWRYDPIFITEKYHFDYHTYYFAALAQRLAPYTRRCTISFLDFYRNTAKNMAGLGLLDFPQRERERLAAELAKIARAHGLTIDACAEPLDLSRFGVERARCVDPERFAGPLGAAGSVKKDPNQRPDCGCAASVDIGMYDTCAHGCRYCYAVHSRRTLARRRAGHDPASPLLTGTL